VLGDSVRGSWQQIDLVHKKALTAGKSKTDAGMRLVNVAAQGVDWVF
jgi:hypothetical protein